jgi:hypothetical protein
MNSRKSTDGGAVTAAALRLLVETGVNRWVVS